MNKYRITFIVDVNDADYRHCSSNISEETYQELLPLIKKIAIETEKRKDEENFRNFNYNYDNRGELMELYNFTEDELEFLVEFIDCGDYGCHTLKSVIIHDLPIVENDLMKTLI